jgi:hypothetical protein
MPEAQAALRLTEFRTRALPKLGIGSYLNRFKVFVASST